MYSCQAKGAGVLARPQGCPEYLRRVPVVVNARAVRPQQVVIAQTSKHTRTRARTHTRTCPHAHAHADIRELQAAALVLHADEPVARAFLLTRLPAAPSATPSATPSVGFLPAHSMGARRRTHTLEPCAMVAARMLVTVALVVCFLVCLCCRRGGGRGAPRRPSRPADRPAGAAALAPPRGGIRPDPTPPVAWQVHWSRKLGRGRQEGRERYRACSIVRKGAFEAQNCARGTAGPALSLRLPNLAQGGASRLRIRPGPAPPRGRAPPPLSRGWLGSCPRHRRPPPPPAEAEDRRPAPSEAASRAGIRRIGSAGAAAPT